MSGCDKHRAATTAVNVAAAGDRSRLASLLFDSPAADCSDCTNADCADRRLRLQAEADAVAPSASSSASSSAPAAVAAPGPRKKCSQCSRDRPESSFSNAQLKLKGKRQCRDCIDPICTVCGEGDSARASGAPPASPATSTLRPLLVKRPRPAADFVIMSHYSCAEMLSGRIDHNGTPATITDVPAGLCDILTSHCADCDRDGGALQCDGCSRVYHGACGGALRFANPKEGSVYPSHMRGCPHCTSQLAPLQSDISSSDPSASVCAACGFTEAAEVATMWTRDWNRLQPVRVEMKPTELLLPMHIGCARRLTDLNSAQLVMPPEGSGNAPLLKNLSEHLQATLAGACACCQKPGGTARCSGCSCRFHHLCLGVQLNHVDMAFATAPMRNCPVCTQSLRIIDRTAADAAFGDAKAMVAASNAGASSAASASSSSSAIPAGSKKCAQCQLHLPESDYSASQLKAKGKRQCKFCVTDAQSLEGLSAGPVDAETKMIRCRLAVLTPCLINPLESEQSAALRNLALLVKGYPDRPFALLIGARLSTRLVELTAEDFSDEVRTLAIGCIALMAINVRPQSPLLAALVQSGAVPFIVSTLRRPQSHNGAHNICINILTLIAKTSRSNCDVLLAAKALDALLPLIRPDMDSILRHVLFSTLDSLLESRTVAEAAAAVTHHGAALMAVDSATPPEFICACLNALGDVVASFPDDNPNLDPWVESILTAAPGIPQRLVELMGDARPNVALSAQSLMVALFRAHTDQLRQLFDCGLRDMLLRLLNDAGGETTDLLAVPLCANAAATKVHALTLIDSAPITQRLLALLSTSDAGMMRCTVAFFLGVLTHMDRRVTRRLVDDYRILPPLVAALRRATESGDQTVTYWCLGVVATVLLVGEAEAVDDERGVNPYIEPIDWLGAFEIADPLQKSADPNVAAGASRVFSYFIPNDCD